MSSKNTGKPPIVGDPYETPEWCVDECIANAFPDLFGSGYEPKTILEPSAGSGVFIRLLRRRYPNAIIHGIDIDPKVGPWPEADLSVHGNFLSSEFGQGGLLKCYDLVIGNPPYTFSLPFVKQGSVVGRQVTFLLRAGFLESEERNHYLRNVNPPVWEHILANRPAFVTTKTDSCVYMWISWGPVFGPEVVTRSRVMPSVPRGIRRKVKPDRALYMEKLFQ